MSKNIDVDGYPDDNTIPETVTEDRSNLYKILEGMLENPDENGIYPTTKALNKLERLIREIRLETVGWVWAEVCVQLDNNQDPRKYDISLLIEKVNKELNPLWKYEKLKKEQSTKPRVSGKEV